MKTWTCIAAVWVAGLLQAQESTGGFRLSFVNDLTYQSNRLAQWAPGPSTKDRDPEDAWRQFNESFSLLGSHGFTDGGSLSWSLTARGTNFYQQSSEQTLGETDATLYRKSMKYTLGGFSAQAGDFHAMLGRGLVLSVLPIDKLLKERTIEGADLHYRWAWIEARGLAGRIRTETRDQAWRVQGGELLVAFLKGPTVGTHRLGFHQAGFEDVDTSNLDEFQRSLAHRRTVKSLSLSGNAGTFSYYAESARIHWEAKVDDLLPLKDGTASYAQASFKAGPVYVLAEARRSLRFETDLINPANTLNNPPLVDRDEEKNNLVHSEAKRLLVQYSFRDPDLAVFVSAGEIKENGVGDETSPGFHFDSRTEVGHNIYGGLSAEDLWDRLTLSVTYGVKRLLYDETRLDASATWRLSGRWSLEVKHRDKHHVDPLTALAVQEKDWTFQLSRSPRVAIYATQQYRTEPGKNFTGHVMRSGGVRFYASKTSYVDVSGGSIRGGLVCSGGQCRELPDFKGWKLATHFQF